MPDQSIPVNVSYLLLVCRLVVGTEPKFTIIIRSDPEGITSRGGSTDITGYPCSIAVTQVCYSLHGSDQGTRSGVIRVIDVAGKAAHSNTVADIVPYLVSNIPGG